MLLTLLGASVVSASVFACDASVFSRLLLLMLLALLLLYAHLYLSVMFLVFLDVLPAWPSSPTCSFFFAYIESSTSRLVVRH